MRLMAECALLKQKQAQNTTGRDYLSFKKLVKRQRLGALFLPLALGYVPCSYAGLLQSSRCAVRNFD